MTLKTTEVRHFDIVVAGGGMAGICAAIASARHGARTALIQNRPVLGGNASSEIRMHICGADCHGSRPDARETGILEEILLENRMRNPQHSFSVFDTVLWEKVRFQENLELFLNTHVTGVEVKDHQICSIAAEQLTTEKAFLFQGSLFIDATGDGTLAAAAGAEYMEGREGKQVFGEAYAPDESDTYTMGNTLLFKAVDTGKPVPFRKPFWANTYTEDDFCFRDHSNFTSGYWWIELGGGRENVITDGEQLRDELLKSVYGVWDHIKNSGHHPAENYALDWVGFLPGKRESRRISGDYVLTEQDCLSGRIFEDAVAYGGWPMDMHILEGFRTRQEPTRFIHLTEVYTIPYRCLYSKNIDNLMMAGRHISASHMAFGSTRIMATCSVLGQACGTAAAMAVRREISPRQMQEHIRELQQTLIKEDCHIPGFRNEDGMDIAPKARISCSSSLPESGCENVVNGISRKTGESSNCWISEDMGEDGAWLMLEFGKPVCPTEVLLKFDSNLSRELMISISEDCLNKQVPGIPPELAKNYSLEFCQNGRPVHTLNVSENHQRYRVHPFQGNFVCDSLKIQIGATWGDPHARIFEVRVYENKQ